MKRSKIIAEQPKTMENLNIVDIKTAIAKHRRTSHKLSKTIRKTEKVGADISLLVKQIKVQIF